MWLSIHIYKDVLESEDILCFKQRVRIIEDLYNKILFEEKVKVKGITKIAISISNKEGLDFIGKPIKGIIPVVRYDRFYDLTDFSKLNDSDRNFRILDFINEGMHKLSKSLEWNIEEQIINVYEKVLESNFVHKYFEVSPKLSSDKKRRAGVEIRMEDGAAQLLIHIENVGSGEVYTLPIIKVHPNRMFIKKIVGKAKWRNNNSFIITDETGEINFCVFIDNYRIELFFTPKLRSQKELIDELLIISIDQNQIENLL
jgi:hypothetical protein